MFLLLQRFGKQLCRAGCCTIEGKTLFTVSAAARAAAAAAAVVPPSEAAAQEVAQR